MDMSSKKKGTKPGKGKSTKGKKLKCVEVAMAPAIVRLLEAERNLRNSSQETTNDVTSFSDIVNEALHAFLTK
jgi:hypothetical protein